MQLHDQIATMDERQLRKLAAELIEKVTQQDQEIRAKAESIERDQRELHRRQLKIDQLTHEMAVLKRWKFAARSERLDSSQRSLLDESIDADLAAMEVELESLRSSDAMVPAKSAIPPKRAALPAHLPRTEIRHEPEVTTCACGCEMKRI